MYCITIKFADIWSKKGLTSYLGITAHLFGREDHHRHRIVFAVRRYAHPHTGERVREVVEVDSGRFQ